MIENYERNFNDDYETEVEKKDEFIVDNVEKAMWCLSKIEDARRERDFYIDACKKQIEKYKNEIEKAEKRCENDSNYFLFALNAYMDREDVPSKDTKTQRSLRLPNGKIVRKFAKKEIVDSKGNTGAKLKTNKELIKLAGDEFKKVTTELNWAEFKKHLVITDDIVMTDEGEVLDCLTVQETLPSVDVQFEKGENNE